VKRDGVIGRDRPHVSNDNSFSESRFATVKGHPEFPDRFVSFEHAYDFCRRFFRSYNAEHRHSGIAWLTPEMVHSGRGHAVLDQRSRVLDTAYAAHPERFVQRRPQPARLPAAVWINPPLENDPRGCPRIHESRPDRRLSIPPRGRPDREGWHLMLGDTAEKSCGGGVCPVEKPGPPPGWGFTVADGLAFAAERQQTSLRITRLRGS